MTRIHVKFKETGNGCGLIYYKIAYRRFSRRVLTDYRVSSGEWDGLHDTLRVVGGERYESLRTYESYIRHDTARLRTIAVRTLAACADDSYAIDEIVAEYNRQLAQLSFMKLLDSEIARLRTLGRRHTADNYVTARNSFSRFMEGLDVRLDIIDGFMMENYEAWLRKSGVVPNTVSFYMRTLRTVYNRAVESGLVSQTYPFRKVYTGFDSTVKRALSLRDIQAISRLDLSSDPRLQLARDIFMFSFYTRGMSFIDIAHLRKSDLGGGTLVYVRRKTRRLLKIRWEAPMQAIVDRYADRSGDYLLPILTGCPDSYAQCRNRHQAVNRLLKEIAREAGITIPLTTYVARHSWASIARDSRIPLSVISEGMGHKDEKTTQIYLATINDSVIDRANRMIISKI